MTETYSELIKAAQAATSARDYKRAQGYFGRALLMRPSNASLLNAYAQICDKTGDKADAWRAYRKLLRLRPDDRTAATQFARLCLSLGRKDDEGLTRRAVASKPRREEKSGGLLKKIFGSKDAPPRHKGMSAEQSRQYETATKALARREMDVARETLDALAEALPDNLQVRRLRGEVELVAANRLEAYQVLDDVYRAGVTDNRTRTLLVTAAARAEYFDRAAEVLGEFSAEDAGSKDAMLAKARYLQMLGQHDEALALGETMEAEFEPDHEVAQLMVNLLSGVGRFDELEPWLVKYSERLPQSANAYMMASINRLLTPDSALFDKALERSEDPALAQSERAGIHFAIARSLMQAGRHDEAFPRLKRANDMVDRTYNPYAEQAKVDRVKELFTRDLLAKVEGDERGKGMVFVFGMLRSGSTLTAQILASHPDAMSIGESGLFAQCYQRAYDEGYPDNLLDKDLSYYAELGQEYLDKLPPEAKASPVVVDKELLKFLNLGLLRLMLPGAKLVHTARNPMDVCFSIYCQHFIGTHPYAYRQETLAHFNHLHDEIMAHWNEVMPGAIHKVQYEDMVADTRGETDRLLAAAGLTPHEDCYEFHKAKTAVSTASVYQVRQKVYKTSVNAWEKYAEGLQPLKKGLENKPFQDGMWVKVAETG